MLSSLFRNVSRIALISAVMFTGATSRAAADVPSVVTDIAPVGSLAAMVLGDLGTPQVLVESGASAHGMSLRPSQARALQQADFVIWVGPELEPWLDESLTSLAPQGQSLVLTALPGTHVLPGREEVIFAEAADTEDEAHEHEHDHEQDGAEHAHEDHAGHDEDEQHDAEHSDHEKDDHESAVHADHDHADHADHGEHEDGAHSDQDHDAEAHDDHETHDDNHEGDNHADESHDDHGHHDHSHAGGIDPHVWLDPENAMIWLDAIAAAMGDADPEHAADYLHNAAQGKAEIAAAVQEARRRLEPVRDLPLLAFHDAYQYFEKAFDLTVAAAVSLSDASDPGPARLAALRDLVAEHGVACAITEPQFSMRRLDLVLEGTSVRRVHVDPLGAELPLGADQYPALILAMATGLAGCVAP